MSDTTATKPAENGVDTSAQGGRTFTQEDVNRIVQERLSREKTKLEAPIGEREQELAHREFMLEARETLHTKGLPLSLLDALNTTSREAFEKSLAILEENKETLRPTPPPYASGTGTNRMIGDANADEVLRQGFGLSGKLNKLE